MMNTAEYPLTFRAVMFGIFFVSMSSILQMIGGSTPSLWFLGLWGFAGCYMSVIVYFRRYATVLVALWAAVTLYAVANIDAETSLINPAEMRTLYLSSAVFMVPIFAVIGYAQLKGYGKDTFFGRDHFQWNDAAMFLALCALLIVIASGVL